jgi:hypothetical protein
MRWQRLFADLEAQFVAATSAAELAETASRARAEGGSVHLAERLAGALGQPVRLRCRGAGQVAGLLVEVGPDWLLLSAEQGREFLVVTDAVTLASGLVRRTQAVADGHPRVRTDLRRALRGLVRDRSTVSVVLADGGRLTGTLDRVGADFVEVAEHAADEPRRASSIRAVHAVPLRALAVVSREADGAG